MTKRNTVIAVVLLLAAGAGCQKCVEPTEQEKRNQDPAPFATFKGRVGHKQVGPVLGADAAGPKAAEADAGPLPP